MRPTTSTQQIQNARQQIMMNPAIGALEPSRCLGAKDHPGSKKVIGMKRRRRRGISPSFPALVFLANALLVIGTFPGWTLAAETPTANKYAANDIHHDLDNHDNDDDDWSKAVESRLAEHQKLMQQIESVRAQKQRLQTALDETQQKFWHLSQTTKTMESLIRNEVNVMATQHLKDAITEIYDTEVAARQQEAHAANGTKTDKDKSQSDKKKTPEFTDYVTREELDELLEPTQIFQDHDASLQKWCNHVLDQTFKSLDVADQWDDDEWEETMQIALGIEQDDEDDDAKVTPDAKKTDSRCATPQQAAQEIQTALSFSMSMEQSPEYQSFDHATNAAWIVHEMTSETFYPNQINDNSEPDDDDQWWFQYIPDDWMDAVGWVSEHVMKNNVDPPETVLTRLVSQWSSWKARFQNVNPPETVLHPLVLPGACWPMKTTTQGSGYLTMALPYAIYVQAISVDHVSRSLLLDRDMRRVISSDDGDEAEVDDPQTHVAKSAPKRIKVIGYPPCVHKNCNGLTFDPTRPLEITTVEYDASRKAPSSQTFVVEYEEEEDEEDNEDEDAFDLDPPSCTVPLDDVENGGYGAGASSCSSGFAAEPSMRKVRDDDRIAAFRFEILENYGNDDFTCLYRLRVHGDTGDEEKDED